MTEWVIAGLRVYPDALIAGHSLINVSATARPKRIG